MRDYKKQQILYFFGFKIISVREPKSSLYVFKNELLSKQNYMNKFYKESHNESKIKSLRIRELRYQ